MFQQEPPNTWVAEVPFVWLPTVLVQAALFGHILVFRRISIDAASASTPRAVNHPP